MRRLGLLTVGLIVAHPDATLAQSVTRADLVGTWVSIQTWEAKGTKNTREWLLAFRDDSTWTWSAKLNGSADPEVKPDNGRWYLAGDTLWRSEATDTTYDPLAGLDHELKTINPMFSMKDIIKMMGPNTASYIQMGDQLGTLESGKIADIILLDGNPLEGYWNMLKTKVVVKGGRVVVDKR